MVAKGDGGGGMGEIFFNKERRINVKKKNSEHAVL